MQEVGATNAPIRPPRRERARAARSPILRQFLNVSWVPPALQEYFEDPCTLQEDSFVVL